MNIILKEHQYFLKEKQLINKKKRMENIPLNFPREYTHVRIETDYI